MGRGALDRSGRAASKPSAAFGCRPADRCPDLRGTTRRPRAPRGDDAPSIPDREDPRHPGSLRLGDELGVGRLRTSRGSVWLSIKERARGGVLGKERLEGRRALAPPPPAPNRAWANATPGAPQRAEQGAPPSPACTGAAGERSARGPPGRGGASTASSSAASPPPSGRAPTVRAPQHVAVHPPDALPDLVERGGQVRPVEQLRDRGRSGRRSRPRGRLRAQASGITPSR